MDSISEFCKVQENATDADMKMWKGDADPKPRIVKCLDACVGEKMGMVRHSLSLLFIVKENPLNLDDKQQVKCGRCTEELRIRK